MPVMTSNDAYEVWAVFLSQMTLKELKDEVTLVSVAIPRNHAEFRKQDKKMQTILFDELATRILLGD